MTLYADDSLPRAVTIAKVEADGYFLTHVIWRNSMGSYEPETGIRTRAAEFKDFRLVQHGCDDWPLVTDIVLKSVRKGWHECKIADVIAWVHERNRRRRRPRHT